MNNNKMIEQLKEWNKHEWVKEQVTGNKRLVFKNPETFATFGAEGKGVLNPFNDYTYQWLSELFDSLIEHLQYDDNNTIENFDDIFNEEVDRTVDVYTSELLKWLSHHADNLYYLEDASSEGFHDNLLPVAQAKAISELWLNALRIIDQELGGDEE
jgi:hypothetical protein